MHETLNFAAPLWEVLLSMEIYVNSGLPIAIIPCLHQSNIDISYGEGEPKNVNPGSVQKAYGPVRACKLPGSMQLRMGPTIESCVNSGLPIAMVPCLLRCNVHVKRNLWGKIA